MRESRWIRKLTPLKIASVYSAIGLFWIAVSDYVLLRLFVSERTFLAFQPVIGGIFIALPAVVIWGLMRRREQEIEASRASLERVTQRLHVLEYVNTNLQREGSSFTRMEHRKSEELTDAVLDRIDGTREYFLGIDGESVFESRDPASAAITAVVGSPVQ